MTNEEYAAVIDEFAAAVYEVAGEVKPETSARLVKAAGNYFEAISQRATQLVTGAFAPVLEHLGKIDREVGELARRFDRRQASNADITTALRDIQAELHDHRSRLSALEQAVGDASGN